MTAIDLSPLINGIIVPLMTPILMALASWALAKVAAYAHFQISDGQRAVLETAIANGIAYAERALAGAAQVTVNQKAAVALNYVLPKVPGALKTLGVTPEHLAQLIAARLPA